MNSIQLDFHDLFMYHVFLNLIWLSSQSLDLTLMVTTNKAVEFASIAIYVVVIGFIALI